MLALGRWWRVVCMGLLAGLAGCAATGPKGVEMSDALASVPPGMGRIVFYRSNSMFGAAIQPEIRLDGQVVGQSRPGGFFYVDVAPGKHEASSSTEATSNIDVHVMAGQTHYVRSAISFGMLVGRVELSVEGSVTAQGELPGLSYTGSTPLRLGLPGAGAATIAPAPAPGPGAAPPPGLRPEPNALPLKRGDRVVYRVTERLTRLSREAVYAVDRIEADRVLFNQGGRVEGLDGSVIEVATPIAGLMDQCIPPGGWARPGLALGTRWNAQYERPGVTGCAGLFDLKAQVVSRDLTATPLGDLDLIRIDYDGSVSRQMVLMSLSARVWYAPALKRVVRFESELSARTGVNVPRLQEMVELIAIHRD